MTKKPTIAELEEFMDEGRSVEITPSGKVKINPVEHVLEDVLRISELEKALRQVTAMFQCVMIELEIDPDTTTVSVSNDKKELVSLNAGEVIAKANELLNVSEGE